MNSVLITANIFSDALSPLINLFDKVLVAIHSVVGSWGWSIIVLTILVRTALIPLTLKQIRSMQAMREFAPEIKALQEKYKGDRQKLNEEMMRFYRENEINPFASCLPLLAQAPVFIALFYLLQQDLKPHICPNIDSYAKSIGKSVSQVSCGQVPGSTGQEFLFIPDLTAKATGAVLVVLILLYVGSQLGSTLVMMTPTMDKTQRYIMFALPLFFVIFIVNFPAGLMVYWITTNLWTVGQQFVVKKTSPPIALEATGAAAVGSASKARDSGSESSGSKKSGGLMARLMEASAAAQEEAAAKKAESGDSSKSKRESGKRSASSSGASGRKKQDAKAAGSVKRTAGETPAGGDGYGDDGKRKSGPPPKKNRKKRTGRRR